jgi:acetyl esterase/lipase
MRLSAALPLILALGPVQVLALEGNAAPPAPTRADVSYGSHPLNVLDFWSARGEGPRPLLVYIHGGGWIGGDKTRNDDRQNGDAIRSYLARGISCAAINYRLTGSAPLPAPVHDAARAIQFLRTKAADWNIDKTRIALTGTSAGACTSMWILLHDDLANPKSKDPVLRESTRVCAAAVFSGQTSIDPPVIEGWLGANVLKHPMIWMAVGEPNMAAVMAHYEKHRSVYAEFSPINHLDRNDPPLLMTYENDEKLPSDDAIHHAVFGQKLKEKSDRLGHECYLLVKNAPTSGAYRSAHEFLAAKLLPPR